jgi:hypothetical protein
MQRAGGLYLQAAGNRGVSLATTLKYAHHATQEHGAKEAAQRALAEAQTEKQAVMQAGEVLLTELEQLHASRDDAVRKLTGKLINVNHSRKTDGHLPYILALRAGEVLLAELKQLHTSRDDAVHKLTGEMHEIRVAYELLGVGHFKGSQAPVDLDTGPDQ